jgi:uncharacterized protein (TIGR00369 family)
MNITEAVLDQMNRNPLYHVMGIQIQEAHAGKARGQLQPQSGICWPFPQQPHGGVLFTLMDTTMAWAVWSQLDDGYNCTTVNLDIHYTLPAKSDSFLCTAWSTHKTKRISFLRADIQNSKGQLVAMGQGTFRIIPADLLK